jgi:hypothetical protein
MNTGGSERLRIDTSGKLLVNTSTARAGFFNNVVNSPLVQIEGTSTNTTSQSIVRNSADTGSPFLVLGKTRGTAVGETTVVAASDNVGTISFQGSDGTELVECARIVGRIDGTPGENDMPGALVFQTTADGAASSTERMRIDSSGSLLVGTTNTTPAQSNATGFSAGSGGVTEVSASSTNPFFVNRAGNDGGLVSLRQAGTQEGDISVSGTTVSYNGGHLSRWSQLPDGSKDESIVKGTVMSNLDDMCVWEKEGVVADNEQLNKMKVSDVEADTNVAGVFVNWTIDEDYGVDDMNVAMTGDMIIRIADGVVVQKGDLLMSAGDGTAKPQGDDIVRSKTIAKVTSNYVTCTYADGSYCVPCVLMAC